MYAQLLKDLWFKCGRKGWKGGKIVAKGFVGLAAGVAAGGCCRQSLINILQRHSQIGFLLWTPLANFLLHLMYDDKQISREIDSSAKITAVWNIMISWQKLDLCRQSLINVLQRHSQIGFLLWTPLANFLLHLMYDDKQISREIDSSAKITAVWNIMISWQKLDLCRQSLINVLQRHSQIDFLLCNTPR